MGRAERFLPDRQGAAVQRLRFFRLALRYPQLTEVSSTQSHIGMIGTQKSLFDRERPCQQRFGFSVLPVHTMEYTKIIQRSCDIEVVLAMNGLIDLQGLQIHGFCLNMLALPCVNLRQL